MFLWLHKVSKYIMKYCFVFDSDFLSKICHKMWLLKQNKLTYKIAYSLFCKSRYIAYILWKYTVRKINYGALFLIS